MMPTLPTEARALTIGTFDSHLDPHAPMCDLRKLQFIDAYGLVGTASAVRTALGRPPALEVVPPTNTSSAAHLANMGFRTFLDELGLSTDLPAGSGAGTSGVVVPLRSARLAGGDQALSHILWAQLRDHVDAQVLEAVTEGIWEIVGNALEHSGSDAHVMAQVYTRAAGGKPPDHDDRVQVVVGDVGRGIHASFKATGVRETANELDAIRVALEYLGTSIPDDPGRGQGLSTTMEQVIGLSGQMIIRSGDALVEINRAGTTERKVTSLPGVIVALSLPLYPGEYR